MNEDSPEPRSPSLLARGRDLSDAIIGVLVTRPEASLGEIAQAIGVGRATLHRRYPSRDALMAALALGALEQLAAALERAQPEVGHPLEALRRTVEELLPIGHRYQFLYTQASLHQHDGLHARGMALAARLESLLARAQREGSLRRSLPRGWPLDTLGWLLFAAWEGISEGRIAPVDAPELVISTFLNGLG